MGDRGNICMEMNDGGRVFFYSHWTGRELPETLKSALVRGKNRWNDEPYLARIIFNEMTTGYELEETGFGISTYETDNNHPTIYVSVEKQTVTVGNKIKTFKGYVA